MASMATPQLVQAPPENPMSPVPAVAKAVTVGVAVTPEITYAWFVFAVHTVSPVTEFDAQELITSGVGIGFVVGSVGVPSMLTTAMPVPPPLQAPFGTYEATFVPLASADKELEGWQEPTGGW